MRRWTSLFPLSLVEPSLVLSRSVHTNSSDTSVQTTKQEIQTVGNTGKDVTNGANNNSNNIVSEQQQQQRSVRRAAVPPYKQKKSIQPEDGDARGRPLASQAPDNKKGGRLTIKTKKKAPWGALQLKDAWSQDAMSEELVKGTGNMSERIRREYRYHPEAFRRRHVLIAALMIVPTIILSTFITYYRHSGKWLWEGDPQYLLNLIRQLDTSPRSKLYLQPLSEGVDGSIELPEHVRRYREEKRRMMKEWGETTS